ncbi:hypothetical protein Y032_0281g1265 [Ancylostoma ceylanicum]|uniref:Uncharacterized protein n=1 Tax=Ancylostoma ceylanicum TaxID=53326 RepID=A0A016S7V8_9BILA|nr:hypothetical protein Y032_0281g1265 [Ancylostoma ceylanicum]
MGTDKRCASRLLPARKGSPVAAAENRCSSAEYPLPPKMPTTPSHSVLHKESEALRTMWSDKGQLESVGARNEDLAHVDQKQARPNVCSSDEMRNEGTKLCPIFGD